LTNTSFNP